MPALKIFALIVPVVVIALPFLLQPETGSIEGTVSNQWGPLAGASVTARNMMTSEVTVTKSGPAGSYRIADLPRGRYSLWVEAADHDAMMLFQIPVERGTATRRDVLLKKKVMKESGEVPSR
jgi:hypothetical protein